MLLRPFYHTEREAILEERKSRVKNQVRYEEVLSTAGFISFSLRSSSVDLTLTLPPGFAASSLQKTFTPGGASLSSLTMGVLQIVCVIDSCIADGRRALLALKLSADMVDKGCGGLNKDNISVPD